MKRSPALLKGSRRAHLLACLLSLIAYLAGCRGDPTTVLTRLDESRRLAADLRVRFNQAADASNRAVMADTEEASLAFARETEQATKAVEQDTLALAALLKSLNYAQEAGLLQEFRARLAEYRKLDERILALAIENTNLKARALSFGPASEAADRFVSTLSALPGVVPAKDRCRAESLVAEAILAIREIQVRHAPHIPERDDAVMARLEEQMTRLDGKARAALTSLRELSSATTARPASDALAALDEFKSITTEIVKLSRRNTNVLSLELALRDKPRLAAACDERLQALRAELAKEGPKSTR